MTLSYGVMVTLQILVLSFQVRILVAQQKGGVHASLFRCVAPHPIRLPIPLPHRTVSIRTCMAPRRICGYLKSGKHTPSGPMPFFSVRLHPFAAALWPHRIALRQPTRLPSVNRKRSRFSVRKRNDPSSPPIGIHTGKPECNFTAILIGTTAADRGFPTKKGAVLRRSLFRSGLQFYFPSPIFSIRAFVSGLWPRNPT